MWTKQFSEQATTAVRGRRREALGLLPRLLQDTAPLLAGS
jgi:hypothetical protein